MAIQRSVMVRLEDGRVLLAAEGEVWMATGSAWHRVCERVYVVLQMVNGALRWQKATPTQWAAERLMERRVQHHMARGAVLLGRTHRQAVLANGLPDQEDYQRITLRWEEQNR